MLSLQQSLVSNYLPIKFTMMNKTAPIKKSLKKNLILAMDKNKKHQDLSMYMKYPCSSC